MVAAVRRVIPIVPAGQTQDDGWQRLSTLSEPRLSEMAQNYRELGYEVEIRGLPPRCGDECTSCLDAGEAMGQVLGTLYVRRRADAPATDELFD